MPGIKYRTLIFCLGRFITSEFLFLRAEKCSLSKCCPSAPSSVCRPSGLRGSVQETRQVGFGLLGPPGVLSGLQRWQLRFHSRSPLSAFHLIYSVIAGLPKPTLIALICMAVCGFEMIRLEEAALISSTETLCGCGTPPASSAHLLFDGAIV